MRSLIAALAITLILAGNVYAAKALRFTWGYDEATATEVGLTGFRLYQDGVAIQTLPATAREATTPYLEDREAHIYYATAFSDIEESPPSDAVTVPAYVRGVTRIASGSFTVEIIEVPE